MGFGVFPITCFAATTCRRHTSLASPGSPGFCSVSADLPATSYSHSIDRRRRCRRRCRVVIPLGGSPARTALSSCRQWWLATRESAGITPLISIQEAGGFRLGRRACLRVEPRTTRSVVRSQGGLGSRVSWTGSGRVALWPLIVRPHLCHRRSYCRRAGAAFAGNVSFTRRLLAPRGDSGRR